MKDCFLHQLVVFKEKNLELKLMGFQSSLWNVNEFVPRVILNSQSMAS